MMMTLEQVRSEMAARDMSRKELSRLSGVSQGSLSGFFSGKSKPSKETLEKLSRAFEAPEEREPEFNPRYSPHLLKEAARALGQSPSTIRTGIRRGSYKWGRCVEHPTSTRKTFMVDRKAFYETYGIVLEIPGKDVFNDDQCRIS